MGPGTVVVAPLFAPAPDDGIPGCVHGSLVADEAMGAVWAAAADGHVYAIDALDGRVRIDRPLPAPAGEAPFAVATPLVLGRRLVVAYHTTGPRTALPDVTDGRERHRLAVVDLDSGE